MRRVSTAAAHRACLTARGSSQSPSTRALSVHGTYRWEQTQLIHSRGAGRLRSRRAAVHRAAYQQPRREFSSFGCYRQLLRAYAASPCTRCLLGEVLGGGGGAFSLFSFHCRRVVRAVLRYRRFIQSTIQKQKERKNSPLKNAKNFSGTNLSIRVPRRRHAARVERSRAGRAYSLVPSASLQVTLEPKASFKEVHPIERGQPLAATSFSLWANRSLCQSDLSHEDS